MSMIRVDYDNARAQAKKLDSTIADCETAIQHLKTVIAKIPPCWEGDCSKHIPDSYTKTDSRNPKNP